MLKSFQINCRSKCKRRNNITFRTREDPHDLVVGKDIKSIHQKEKCNQLDYTEMKNLFSTETINSKKVEWKKGFNIYTSSKICIQKISCTPTNK